MKCIRKFQEEKGLRSEINHFFKNSEVWVNQSKPSTYKSSKTGTYISISSSVLIIQNVKAGIKVDLYWEDVDSYKARQDDITIFVKGNPRTAAIALY